MGIPNLNKVMVTINCATPLASGRKRRVRKYKLLMQIRVIFLMNSRFFLHRENFPHHTTPNAMPKPHQVVTVGRNGREVQWNPLLKDDEFVIERARECDLRVVVSCISRSHCKITLDQSRRVSEGSILSQFRTFSPCLLLSKKTPV